MPQCDEWSACSGGGSGEGPVPSLQEPADSSSGDPEPEDKQPWWKTAFSKDDLIVYGTAIAISYGIREYASLPYT